MIKELITVIKQVCSVVEPGDDETKEAACECAGRFPVWMLLGTPVCPLVMVDCEPEPLADLIVSRTLSQSDDSSAVLVTNAILVSLGLLKVSM